MKASLGLLFLGTAALAASSVAQSAQTGATGSVSSQTSATARSGVQAQRKSSAATSAATKVSNKTGKVASASPLKSGTTIQAELVKPVDAKKSKVGDEVIATTTKDVTAGGKVVVPSGSKLVGRIMGVRVQNSEQSTSQVGIAFNRAVLKSGKEIPVALTIQAIGSSPEAAASGESVPESLRGWGPQRNPLHQGGGGHHYFTHDRDGGQHGRSSRRSREWFLVGQQPGSRWIAGSQLVLANHHFRNRLSRQLAGQQCVSRQRDRNDFASESISSRICSIRLDQFPFRGAPPFSRFLR